MPRTTVSKDQIRAGAIDDSKVAPGAAIASSKLADGSNFLERDGSVPMTGAFDFGNQKGVNAATPTASTDVATMGYVDTAIANSKALFDGKDSVRAASTANVNIANPGTAVFDGVTLSNGQRLLLKDQTTASQNGIYIFNGSGAALTRATDMDTWAKVPGASVTVEEGATNADLVFLSTANQGGTLGTTAITWQQVGVSSGLTAANFVDEETPSGTINGSNVTFTLANTPNPLSSLRLYFNGQKLRRGAGNDFTITGNTITLLFAPSDATNDWLEAWYRK